MGFAFVVLCIATRNIIMSILSLFTVACVIVSIISIMVMKGWELGSNEALAIVIVIGFSVDYVVHLAADYTHSAKKSRNDKMK